MTPFLYGFATELEKVAARAGLTLIRKLVAQGTPEAMAKANRLAKTKGVLKDLDRSLIEREGKILLHRGRSPGHQIKHLGGGKEQVSTLVADPQRGIVVRKTHRGKDAITHEKQMDRKAEFGEIASREGLKSAPRHYESFVGPAGRKMNLQEYVKGSKASVDSAAAKKALKEHQEFAKKHGFNLEDMTSSGNVVVRRGKGGKLEGVVLDPIVTKSSSRGKDGLKSSHGEMKSPGEVMRDVFRPDEMTQARYDRLIEQQREIALRKAKKRRPLSDLPPGL